ncbi:MAG: hypothetical protein K8W52_41980 [Deltaproteobacteria bacterium]|nr:hypothetical protein [Deltaproteobacteria bacterium]
MPKDQTLEGGGQVRVTQGGFQKLTSILPALLNNAIGGGICLPNGSIGTPSFTGANYCDVNQGGACGGGKGCNVSIGVHPGSFQVSVTNAQALNLKIGLDVHAVAPLDGHIVFVPASCNLHVDGDNIMVDADLAFAINATTGELEIHLQKVNGFDSSALSLSNCGLLSDLGNLVNGLLNSFLGDFFIQLFTPTLDGLVQGFLPHPLGIEGLVDVGSLLAGVSPGTEAEMELKMVPGGYVDLSHGNGMSLGLITGVNSDWDISTRTVDLDSEPALCVPPIPAPDFGAAPFSLGKSPRATFQLSPAGEFNGSPDPASDLAIGLSETTLDQFGHHAVTSGAMCLGVGTTFVPQLNLGTIGLLVPSLADLGTDSGTDPILLVTRPQRALDFQIGEGTDTSPALTIAIKDMEVDFYAFIYSRYVRAFTLSLTLNVGVNLEFQQLPGMPATVTPQLVGLTAANIQLKVSNSEFVHETPAELEQVLPTVFDLALPLLGNALKPINIPNFAGFTLNDLRVQHVTTSQDDFLAIYASLGASQMMRELGQSNPMMAEVVQGLDKAVVQPGGEPVTRTQATVHVVDVPKPEIVRAALLGKAGGKLPSVTIDVAQRDEDGRELEYSWNLNGGIWRPFTQASPLVISDRAFAWQGKYMIGVRSRVKGDYHTVDEVGVTLPVIIDSVEPHIYVDQVRDENGKLYVPATDITSASADLSWAFGKVGDKLPATAWQHSAALDQAVAETLGADGELMVWVRDEAGNTAIARVPLPFHGAPGEGGCACNTSSSGPSSGGLALFLMVGLVIIGRRRSVALVTALGRRGGRALPAFFVWAGIAVVTSLVPGCSCGGKPGVQACETTEDCAADCPEGTVPLCFDHECACVDDIPYGRIGPYSDVDVSSSGADVWVSAYAQSHGDLVVAKHNGAGRVANAEWEFVDGVPDGPVVVPGSTIRGGIGEPGPNVGMYTSIALAPDDTPMVTYQDVDNGSLKFAAKYGGTWAMHVVDMGTGTIDAELGGEIAGMYSSLTLRSDDGRPGVAYMAEVSDGGGVVRAEVRYAAAQVPNPVSPSDWTTWVVDTITLPPVDPNKPDPYPLPDGLGLFLQSARNPMTQAPVVVYYDRVNGDLKMAEFDATAGTFKAPVVVDGADGTDVGWFPSVAVDAEGTIHIAYQSATRDDLLYVNTKTNAPELIDDGYRIVGQTPEGYPKPEFHFIGNDASLQVSSGGPVVTYQDSTSHELLLSSRTNSGEWQRNRIAGGAEPAFVGAYGFFASSVLTSTDLVISNWVIDQPNYDQWVEIHRQTLTPQ